MKIKEQTRKLAAGCSKHCFEFVDRTDRVSIIYLRQGEADVV
ncbi:Substrate-specific component BioY of biotin ECF transporter [Streptococcus pneumoniae]|nr:Substrate-specific component BioY of biotin ECF transporter [Streptococcus pneumoniae]